MPNDNLAVWSLEVVDAHVYYVKVSCAICKNSAHMLRPVKFFHCGHWEQPPKHIVDGFPYRESV